MAHTAGLFMPAVLSSHDQADTRATTTFDRSLVYPITLLLSFPRYTFPRLARAI